MQVANLGSVNSQVSTGKSSISKTGIGFANILGPLTNLGAISKKGNENSMFTELPKQDLNSILGFLKSDDVLDLENGEQLLGQELNPNLNDLLSSIKDFLGMNEQDLKKMIKNLQSLLSNIKGTNQISSPQQEVAKDSNDLNDLDELVAILNQITSLPIQDLPKVVNKDFEKAVKVVKLYELLSKTQDGLAKNENLKNLMSQVIEKLGTLSIQQKDFSRSEYLQKTFSSLVTEMQSSKQDEIPTEAQDQSTITFKLDQTNGLVHLQQITKPEQMTLMLDKMGKPVSSEQLIQQFESILSKSQFSKIDGTQRLFIKLNPENLGSLRIELIQKDDTIVAKILTTTGAAKDALESQLHGLKHALTAQNIQVDRIEVSQQVMTPQEKFMHREQPGGHPKEQQGQQPSKEQTDDSEFDQSFEEALLNMEA